MNQLVSLEELPSNTHLKKGDLFVLFGELFGRGYANGLVQNAKKNGLEVVSFTMGRREKGQLRPLTDEEKQEAEKLLGGELINIPLEAGFDLEEVGPGGSTVVDMLAGVKIDSWEGFKVDFDLVEKAVAAGRSRFQKSVAEAIKAIEKRVKPGQNIVFAHTMAGGIPRAKIMLAVANRVFKGRGERYVHSGRFWNSDLGKLVSRSFDMVTAETFSDLLSLSKNLREKLAHHNKQVYYTAYGYHGTEVLINGRYQWQTYTPYQQGHAKKKLENYAKQAQEQGIPATVFNCPEIRTNSSDIFLGVELSLFPLLYALEKEGKGPWVEKHFQACQQKLNPEVSLKTLLKELNSYFDDPMMQAFIKFEPWPLENSAELADLMVGTSERVSSLHLDKKDLIADYLSGLVIEASGKLIYESIGTNKPVIWLGHEWIAKQLQALQTSA